MKQVIKQLSVGQVAQNKEKKDAHIFTFSVI